MGQRGYGGGHVTGTPQSGSPDGLHDEHLQHDCPIDTYMHGREEVGGAGHVTKTVKTI